MSELLHVPSLVIAASVTGACVSASHLLTWRAARNEVCVLLWGVAYGLATIALIMLGLRGHIPAFLSITVSNGLLALTSGLIWLGYRRFIGKAAGQDRLWASLGALIWFAVATDRNAFADINFRGHVISTVQFAYLVVLCLELRGQYRKEPLPALSLTMAVIVFQQLMIVARSVYLVFFPVPSADTALPSAIPIGLTLVGSTAVVVLSGLLQLVLVAQRSERRFRIAAETDDLTGLANRRRFMNEVLPRLADRPVHGALALFDLDHFKSVNDTHGHLTGDRMLVGFSDILAKAAPENAITARIGGEEFALFLPNANLPTAVALAEQICQQTRGFQLTTPRGSLGITVSGGVAGVAEIGCSYEALHSAADAALYNAKSDGRDRIAVHRQGSMTPTLVAAKKNARCVKDPLSVAV